MRGRVTGRGVRLAGFALLRRLAGKGFPVAGKGVPHSGQNLAPGGRRRPQLGQSRGNGVPHSIQNFAPAGFSVPQLSQRILPLYSFTRSGARKTPGRDGLTTAGLPRAYQSDIAHINPICRNLPGGDSSQKVNDSPRAESQRFSGLRRRRPRSFTGEEGLAWPMRHLGTRDTKRRTAMGEPPTCTRQEPGKSERQCNAPVNPWRLSPWPRHAPYSAPDRQWHCPWQA